MEKIIEGLILDFEDRPIADNKNLITLHVYLAGQEEAIRSVLYNYPNVITRLLSGEYMFRKVKVVLGEEELPKVNVRDVQLGTIITPAKDPLKGEEL